MKAFLETSIPFLVGVFYADHGTSRAEHRPVLRFKDEVCCARHTLAEVYATLTRVTRPRRVSGDDAAVFLGDVRERQSESFNSPTPRCSNT